MTPLIIDEATHLSTIATRGYNKEKKWSTLSLRFLGGIKSLDLLNLIIASEENRRPLMNLTWYQIKSLDSCLVSNS